jgi:hypothetical protein
LFAGKKKKKKKKKKTFFFLWVKKKKKKKKKKTETSKFPRAAGGTNDRLSHLARTDTQHNALCKSMRELPHKGIGTGGRAATPSPETKKKKKKKKNVLQPLRCLGAGCTPLHPRKIAR